MQSVWLIADQATNKVSYIQHGLEGDETHWRWIGPFAYTSLERAQEVAKDPTFLPVGVIGRFTTLEVEVASFIQAVYNGFPPTHTDVFALDSAMLPLTAGGAAWLDDALKNTVWTPLFDEGGESVGLNWLDRVLEIVANRLGVSMETVQAIGTLNATEEDAADVEQTQSLIRRHVRLTLTPEPGTLAIQKSFAGHDLTTAALFWVCTNGLAKLGLPELEIRNVPARWVTAAGDELLRWAAYSLDHGIVEGVPLREESPISVVIGVSESPDLFWVDHVTGCLRLSVEKVALAEEHTEDHLMRH